MDKIILPCPFCGAECKIVAGDFKVTAYRVQCLGDRKHALDCWDDSREDAIDTWNKRISITIPLDEVELQELLYDGVKFNWTFSGIDVCLKLEDIE